MMRVRRVSIPPLFPAAYAGGVRVTADRRAVLVDAALGVAVVLVVTAAMAADIGGRRAPDAFAYLCAVGLGALMLVRRPFPVPALVATAVGILAYYVAGYPVIGLELPMAAALYSAAEGGRTRVAVGVAAAMVLVSQAARLAEGDDAAQLIGLELAVTIATMAAAVALGSGTRVRRLLRAEQADRERRLALDQERAAARRVEEERLRIAREVHDVLAHTVSVISLHADVAAEALADDTEAARTALGHVRAATDQALREIRTTVGLLRGPSDTPDTAPVGGLAQLDRLVAAATAGGLPVALRVEGEPAALPAAVDATAYRIVQEALTNTIRHAGAASAEVRLRYGGGRLHIRVADDGCGTGDAGDTGMPAAAGHGLIGMRERAALLGGTVEAGDLPGGGFAVRAALPVEPR
jgi:signal transduction histidine kinase